ncbi:MAG: acetamidase/formamidase family protein [Halobacteriaceae archaeon]
MASDPDHALAATDENVHRDWDRARDPVATVAPGDVVRFECRHANGEDLDAETTADDLDFAFRGHRLTGPVAVEGATPGDTLAVDVLDVDHHGWGYTMVRPGDQGVGLLPESFPDAAIHHWDLDGDVGRFVDGIEVGLAPFPGCVGLAPAAEGPHSTTPPRRVGGNLDVKHLVAGSTVYLPVEVAGALLSVGDGHAAQGDGEVCVTAIEAPVTVTARVRLAERSVDGPELETPGPFAPAGVDGRAVGTTGVADDLMAATREAVLAMVDRVTDRTDLTPTEAYMLCSVAADLKVSEVVNAPNYVVTALLPASMLA